MRLYPMHNGPLMGFTTPFGQLERMRRQLEQLFEGAGSATLRYPGAGVFPLINLTEDADHYYLIAELPGLGGTDLEILADGKSLSVAGERRIEAEGEEIKYHRKEREAGKFSRIVTLPGEIEPDRIEAKMADGILTVVMPKAGAVKPRRVAVN